MGRMIAIKRVKLALHHRDSGATKHTLDEAHAD